MKKILVAITFLFGISNCSVAQKNKTTGNIEVPSTVKEAFIKKYPETKNVHWQRRDDDYEAQWKKGNSVVFTPSGKFIEETVAMPVDQLPEAARRYINMTYNSAITGAGKVTDLHDKTSYVAFVNGAALVLDKNGRFIKAAKK